MDYPEHEKMKAALEAGSQHVGEFLESTPYVLAEWREDDTLQPVRLSVDQVLAEHYGIDLGTIECEKRAMLAALQG